MLESRSAYGYYGSAGGYTGETRPSGEALESNMYCSYSGAWDDRDRDEEYFASRDEEVEMEELRYVVSLRRVEIRSSERFSPLTRDELENAISAACTRIADYSPVMEDFFYGAVGKEAAMKAYHDMNVDYTFGRYGNIHTLTIEEAMVEVERYDAEMEEYMFIGLSGYKLPDIDWDKAM